MENKSIATVKPEIKVEYFIDTIDHNWDAFVDEMDGEIHQTSVWAEHVKLSKGWHNHRFCIKRGNDIIAGCQFRIIEISFLGKVGYVQLGPCLKEKTPKVMKMVVKEIKKTAHKKNFLYLAIAPNYVDNDIVPYLEAAKFKIKKSELHPHYIMGATLMLDLTQSVEDLFAQLKSTKRKNIRKGLENNIQFKVGARNDLETFYDLTVATAKKFGSDAATNKLEDLYDMWDLLYPKGWINLHLGIVEGQASCASLSITIGETFQDKYWGWDLKYGDLFITDVFQWTLIKWAKENGYKYYDLVGIDLPSAEAILAKNITDSIKSSKFYGPTFFKMTFGGFIVKYPETYTYFPSKIKKILIHQIAEHKNFKRIISVIYKLLNKKL